MAMHPIWFPLIAALTFSSCTKAKEDLVRAQGGMTVEAGIPFVPEILFRGKYYPICAYSFANNDIGATTFCKLLGFNKGSVHKTWDAYEEDAMLVGKCMHGDELTKCTGGNNYWGDLTTCKKGSRVGVKVDCTDLISKTITSSSTTSTSSSITVLDTATATTTTSMATTEAPVNTTTTSTSTASSPTSSTSSSTTDLDTATATTTTSMTTSSSSFSSSTTTTKLPITTTTNSTSTSFSFTSSTTTATKRPINTTTTGTSTSSLSSSSSTTTTQPSITTTTTTVSLSTSSRTTIMDSAPSKTTSVMSTSAKITIASTLVRAQGGMAVEAGKRFVPEIFFHGEFYPICTYSFDNNGIGATIFCNLLGFNEGHAIKTHDIYDEDAMLVGKCMHGDEELSKCTGGNNYWGDLTTCKKGSRVGVKVVCLDPALTTTATEPSTSTSTSSTSTSLVSTFSSTNRKMFTVATTTNTTTTASSTSPSTKTSTTTITTSVSTTSAFSSSSTAKDIATTITSKSTSLVSTAAEILKLTTFFTQKAHFHGSSIQQEIQNNDNETGWIVITILVITILAIFVAAAGIILPLYLKHKTKRLEHHNKEVNPFFLANYGLFDIATAEQLKEYGSLERGFESSNFRRVKEALNRRLAEINGVFPSRYITSAVRGLINEHVQNFDSGKMSQSENLLTQTEMAMARDTDSVQDAGVMAELYWTTTLSIEGIELCSILNAAIRKDHPKNIVHATVFAKGIEMRRNLDRDNFTDLTQKYPDVKATADMFPGGVFPERLAHQNWLVSFRGGGFKDDFQKFFTVGKLYRCPGFLATSVERKVSEKFLKLKRATGMQTVLWTILLDGRGSEDHKYRCMHASYVVKSHLGGEKEFLFSPYSVFEVISTEWSSTKADPHSVVLRAAIDNMQHPECLELAPWY